MRWDWSTRPVRRVCGAAAGSAWTREGLGAAYSLVPVGRDDRDGDRLFPAVPGGRSRGKRHQQGLERFRLQIRK